MPTFAFNLYKRPPNPAYQYRVVQDAVRDGVQRNANKRVRRLQAAVSNWEHQPRFIAQVGVGPKVIYSRIKVDGPEEVVQNWLRVDKFGAKPHVIMPRRQGGVLVIKDSKKVGGKPWFSRKVNHPGFKPKRISERINRELKPDLANEIRNGVRRGMNRISK